MNLNDAVQSLAASVADLAAMVREKHSEDNAYAGRLTEIIEAVRNVGSQSFGGGSLQRPAQD